MFVTITIMDHQWLDLSYCFGIEMDCEIIGLFGYEMDSQYKRCFLATLEIDGIGMAWILRDI